MSVKAFLKF